MQNKETDENITSEINPEINPEINLENNENEVNEENIFSIVNKFKLPIEYLSETQHLDTSIMADLEINTDIYKTFIQNTNELSKQTMPLFYSLYTTNIPFLKDTQKILSTFPFTKVEHIADANTMLKIYGSWKTINLEPRFNERYDYLTYEKLEPFNHYESFLQIMSIYTLSSPVLALLTPVLFLIIPFFIIKLTGKSISMANYLKILKTIITRIPIGKLFTFSSMNTSDRVYALVSLSFYIFQMYQNCIHCYRFYKNLNYMYDTIYSVRDFCRDSQLTISLFLDYIKENELTTYYAFGENLLNINENLAIIEKRLRRIHSNKFTKERIFQTGRVMKEFYEIRNSVLFDETINYTFAFFGYLDNMFEMQNTLKSKTVNLCSFTDDKSSKMKNSYYLTLPKDDAVKNAVTMDKNIVISGQNATGKTTYVKSSIINHIVSQQFGFGFYDNARIHPYDYFHCYLNIPDTSGRDSLFQAEVRRCKEILDVIENKSDKRHLCIFDELFSGTNPYEATSVGVAYVEYLNKNPNVSFMLTTHYLDLCKHVEDTKRENKEIKKIINMNTEKKYTLSKGICKTRGGIKVLEDFSYPEDIIKKAKEIISLD